jgi:hypothetical protein
MVAFRSAAIVLRPPVLAELLWPLRHLMAASYPGDSELRLSIASANP